MKPFWREPYREQFLERAGLYLLYAFILSIAANPFIMWGVGLDKFQYVVIESQIPGYTPLSQLSPQQQEIVSKYHVATPAELERMAEFQESIEWITVTALLGWCVTSPRFMRGWAKILVKLKEEKNNG